MDHVDVGLVFIAVALLSFAFGMLYGAWYFICKYDLHATVARDLAVEIDAVASRLRRRR